MNTQLFGQIIAAAVLGLVLFCAVAYIVALVIENSIKSYFACKLTYTRLLMDEPPSDRFKDVVAEIVKRHANGSEKVV